MNDSCEVDEDDEERCRFLREYKQDAVRRWSDAREYGFISAGHGEWYHRTMGKATEGSRLFVYHPGEGYIGVGEITQEKTAAPEFMVTIGDEEVPITEAPLDGDLSRNEDDPDLREYIIGVDWIAKRDIEDAVWESEMYANQNTVTKLRDQYTLDRLYDAFGVPEPSDI